MTKLTKMLTRTHINLTRHQYSSISSRSPNLQQLGRQPYPEHLLHALNCAAPDQSKRAITSLTKFAHLASRGKLRDFVAPILCSATLTALKKLKGGVHPIAVGQVVRHFIAKCIAREANSEAADLFNTKQLGVAAKGGAESIVHATRNSVEKLQKSKNPEYCRLISKMLSI